jgi:hypothetical protein
MKTGKTSELVDRIVNVIDAIVRIACFDRWQHSATGERNVGKYFWSSML